MPVRGLQLTRETSLQVCPLSLALRTVWLTSAPTSPPCPKAIPTRLAVHCKGGKGRTGTMICALMMMMMNISCAEAIDLYVLRFLSVVL